MSNHRAHITDIHRTNVLVWVRSSFPGMGFSQFQGAARGLSPAGFSMAREVSSAYAGLLHGLSRRFGSPTFFSALDLGSMLTAGNMFTPEHIVGDERLGESFDLRTINHGRWYQERHDAGVSWADMLDELHNDLERLSPAAHEAVERACTFIFDRGLLAKTRFRVVISPESMISLTVARAEPETDDPIRLGLHSGQAYIIRHNADRVTRVERFEPAASRIPRDSRESVAQNRSLAHA